MPDNDSSSSPIVRIPAEVFSKILVAVGDDHRTLSACSLVAKRWHDIAVPFLFSTIVFRGGKHRPFALLWDFLEKHPHVTQFVKGMRISSDIFDSNLKAAELRTGIDDVTVEFDKISAVLKLPALKELVLEKLSLSPPPAEEPILPMSLQTLYVDDLLPSKDSDVGRMATVCMLLAACSPHTLKLQQYFSRHLDMEHDVRFISPRSRRIHTVIFDHNAARLHHEWLEAVLVPDVLQELSTCCSTGPPLENTTALRSLLFSAGRCLERLDLTGLTVVDVETSTTHPLAHLSTVGEMLSACARLRLFNIKLYHVSDEDVHARISAFQEDVDVFKRLFSYAPHTLEYITISVLTPSTLSLALCDLASLDRPWFRGRCPALKRMHVRYYGTHALPPVESAAVAALPGLHRAGLLRVTLNPSAWS